MTTLSASKSTVQSISAVRDVKTWEQTFLSALHILFHACPNLLPGLPRKHFGKMLLDFQSAILLAQMQNNTAARQQGKKLLWTHILISHHKTI